MSTCGACRRAAERRRGFTLLELVVAMVLAGAVALIGFGALAQLTDSGARLRETSRDAAAYAARQALTEWLGSAHVSGEREHAFLGVSERGPAWSADHLTFVAKAAPPYANTLTTVTLRTGAQDTLQGVVAELTHAAGAGRVVPIVPRATGLRISYFERVAGEERWIEGWSSSVRLPRAVRIVVEGDTLLPMPWRVPLTVLLGER